MWDPLNSMKRPMPVNPNITSVTPAVNSNSNLSKTQNVLQGTDNITVTNITASPSFSRSFGSFWNSVNKTVSSALNTVMSFQPQDFSTGLKPEHAQQSAPLATHNTPDTNKAPAQSHHGPVGSSRRTTPSPPRTPMSSSSPYQPQPPRSRSPSPRRDIGFSSAVSNIVDQAHAIAEQERLHGGSFRRKGWYSTRRASHALCVGVFNLKLFPEFRSFVHMSICDQYPEHS